MRQMLLVAAAVLLATSARAQVPAGPIIDVETTPAFRPETVSSGVDPAGNFVVVWQNYDQALLRWRVFGQRFDAAGNRRGAEFRVNGSATTHVLYPDVAAAGNGFVITWSQGTFGSLEARAQRFDSSGSAVGAHFAVNSVPGAFGFLPNVLIHRPGQFVVTWSALDLRDNFGYGVLAQRFDGNGGRLGPNFLVNTYTPLAQYDSASGADRDGNFVVVWTSRWQDSNTAGVFGQRYSAGGSPLGGEFQVNGYTTSYQLLADICVSPDGRFVVVWEDWGPGDIAIAARRFDAGGAPLGADFRVDSVTTGDHRSPAIACDAAGNFVVTWTDSSGGVVVRRFAADGTPRSAVTPVSPVGALSVGVHGIVSDSVGNFVVAWAQNVTEVRAQRFGGLLPAALAVNDGGNGVLEVSESFTLTTSWRNVSGAAQSFQSVLSDRVTPEGLELNLTPAVNYGTVADGSVGACTTCSTGSLMGFRPLGHIDAFFRETLSPAEHGQVKSWLLHVGESFFDVPRSSLFYRFVEALLHHQVTYGCSGNAYCPAASTTREQMAVFLLVAKEGAGYAPPACSVPLFNDVPASSPFCPFVEELARRGVTSGCGGGNYCPNDAVTRDQMAVFVLRTLDPALNPPACTTPVFNDVPASSPFCRWVEELARRGITGGCGGGYYCAGAPVTREQMAVFITGTFGLTLYGP